jgi:hypothetical protein
LWENRITLSGIKKEEIEARLEAMRKRWRVRNMKKRIFEGEKDPPSLRTQGLLIPRAGKHPRGI